MHSHQGARQARVRQASDQARLDACLLRVVQQPAQQLQQHHLKEPVGQQALATTHPIRLGKQQAQSGIQAFAVTSHPDFDDTPLFDENGDGNPSNDGNVWHSHWVVLQPDAACGQGALKVVDIPEGTKPRLPKTWPGLPLLMDSPGWAPSLKKNTVEVRVPFDDIGVIQAGAFDGVTAALRVHASVHNPLLCVAQVFKVASGNLSLPGKVNQ